MNKFLTLLVLISIGHSTFASKEITGLLEEAIDLSHEEINALQPLFAQLQLQYDHIISQANQSAPKMDEEFEKIYTNTINDFHQGFANLMRESATTFYDVTLPGLEDLIAEPDYNGMTNEQFNEFLDMKSLIQETLDETQLSLNQLVSRALEVEGNLLKINKPKLIMAILNALGVMFNAAGRVGRAAYCTYSNVPQLNASLHHIYDGVDCYFLTSSLIVKIQNETYQTVKIVKKSILDLASVYKKVANKNSIMGKIVSLLMSLKKITWSVGATLRQANHVIDEVVNQLPGVAAQVINCGTTFLADIPFVVESVSNVTACITFVDDTTNDYGFLDPENSTRIPELYPDPNSGEDSDESFEMF